jgi:hypothetical protein
MRCFRAELIAYNIAVHYTALASKRFEDRARSDTGLLTKGARGFRPSKPVATRGRLSNLCNAARASRCGGHGTPNTRRPTFLMRLTPPTPGQRIGVDWCCKLSTSGCPSEGFLLEADSKPRAASGTTIVPSAKAFQSADRPRAERRLDSNRKQSTTRR